MCEFCKEKKPELPAYGNGDLRWNAEAWALSIEPPDGIPSIEVYDYERDESAVFHVNFCPMCGRKLNEGHGVAR